MRITAVHGLALLVVRGGLGLLSPPFRRELVLPIER